jgi:hypothetical protein
MTQSELAALQKTIKDGFDRIDQRLEAVEEALHDNQQAIHGLMFKLLRVEEVNEIRSVMKSPPDLRNFPKWVLK